MKIIISFLSLAIILLGEAPARAFSTSGFSSPYGIAVDAKSNFIYVSNVNGDPNALDDNGFISRLKGDGTVDLLRFIDGASPKFKLHAPKGMAVLGNTLYVADITALHAFDLSTGSLLFDVNFGTLPVQHFYDVKVGPDGALYLSDGPGNTIYRIDVQRQHEVTRFLSEPSLGQPHGIAWIFPRQLLIVAGWSSGQVHAYDAAGKRQPNPAIFLRTLEGMDADDEGNIYVASSGLNALYQVNRAFELAGFQLGLFTPAGVAFQKSGFQILSTSFSGNTVQSVELRPGSGVSPAAGDDFVQTPEAAALEAKEAEQAKEAGKAEESKETGKAEAAKEGDKPENVRPGRPRPEGARPQGGSANAAGEQASEAPAAPPPDAAPPAAEGVGIPEAQGANGQESQNDQGADVQQ